MNNEIQEFKSPITFKEKCALVVAMAFVTSMPLMSHAAELDFSGVTSELDGVKQGILTIIASLLIIFAIVLGWRTFRRSAG